MQYLDSFRLPDEKTESVFLLSFPSKLEMACYDQQNAYPFKIFPQKQMPTLYFAPITVFYGGNGSGKSTLLNVIAEKLGLARLAPYNETPLYEEYLRFCHAKLHYGRIPKESKIITSDAVFDFLLDVRAINEGIDHKRDRIFDEYDKNHDADTHYQLRSLEDFEAFKQFYEAKRRTKSSYSAKRLPKALPGMSNGESAFAFFTKQIGEQALFLLDEPENSLSAKLQMEFAQYLVDSVRFYNCQFIIATHSPFLLAMKDAVIYDLDTVPVRERKWTELDAPKTYFQFFESHRAEFLSEECMHE